MIRPVLESSGFYDVLSTRRLYSNYRRTTHEGKGMVMAVARSSTIADALLDHEVVDELRTNLRGHLLLPDEEGYDEARTIWNEMIDRRPALTVQPAGVADVISAVNFAREHELLLAIKGGGHNVAGNAICDDGLLIDLSTMNGVTVDPQAQTAYVEGGALWRDFDHETAAFGLTTTGGVNSTTGVAGLTLGGGIGWFNAKYGLACDNVLAFDLVLADGSFVRASSGQHPDLYWALRGGGGNFGVVTGFLFQLHPFDGQVTAGPLMYPIERAKEISYAYRDFGSRISTDVVDYLAFMTEPESGEQVVVIVACHVGSEEAAARELASLKAIPSPFVDAIGRMEYVAWQQAFDADFPHGLHRYWKSHMVKEFSDELLDTLAEWASTLPSNRAAIVIEHYHGKYGEPGKRDTAFWHRDTHYQIAIIDQWTDPANAERGIQWVRGLYDALTPYSTNAPYLNFNLFDEAEMVDRVQASFGENYPRLVRIKNKYDPTNFFRVNNNIPPKDRVTIEKEVG